MTGPLRRWRKDAMTLLIITVPFVLTAAGFLIAGKVNASGWEPLGYLVYAMTTGALWAAVVLCYLVWVVIRDGWQISSAPAMVILTAVALTAAVWAWRNHAQEADCRAALGFYEALAAMPAADRPAAIAAGGRFVTAPSDCAIDGWIGAFGRSVIAPSTSSTVPDAERRATLDALLQAGMPPDYRLLHDAALTGADPVATRLLLRRRKTLNAGSGSDWPLFPDDIVQPLITRARTVPGDRPAPAADLYRATLAVFVEEGLPDPSVLSDWTRAMLVEIGVLASDRPAR